MREEIIDRAISCEVLQEDSSDGGIGVSEMFIQSVNGEPIDVNTVLQNCEPDFIETEFQEQILIAIEEDNPEALRFFDAIRDAGDEFTFLEAIQLTHLVDRCVNGYPEQHSESDIFTPTDKRWLKPFTSLNHKSILYVWKEDCTTCDEVEQHMNNIFSQRPTEVALLSIDGPTHAEYLYDEFAVYGAPTLVFFDQGNVDVRLIGKQEKPAIENEIEKLQ